jgi:hypothetical protein
LKAEEVTEVDSNEYFYTYNFSYENFTIILLPDTQHYPENYPQIFDNQTQWIIENKEKLNIVFVTHLGDIVNNWNSLNSWEDANSSMSKLDNKIAWGILPGDQDGAPVAENLTNYNVYFGYQRFCDKNWYGGAYHNENTNSYQLFSAGGDDYLFFHIQNAPNDDILIWANNTINKYPNRKVIVSTHDYLAGFGINVRSDIGEGIWQKFIKPNSDQIFLVLCGHWPEEGRRTDKSEYFSVHQLLANYQFRTNGGNGWLRILKFVPLQDKIFVKTYSSFLNQYETDLNSDFVLEFDMTATEASIMVLSSSPVSQFVFNRSLAEISFEVSDEADMNGYCNLTIPKDILTGNPWIVDIDGEVCSFISSENATHSYLYFTYSCSKSLLIKINGTGVIPEFTYFIILPLFLIATLLAVTIGRRINREMGR